MSYLFLFNLYITDLPSTTACKYTNRLYSFGKIGFRQAQQRRKMNDGDTKEIMNP